ncbi:inosine/xanthosine triphosphatase [candidate division WWE3 bacterium]|uniref:Probable inosine/xanthosine triphosphatase n=1 Tax=candidate division WWE3 bacterium TaxID=2053526 RepID=A0A955LVJ0_UNCKA|nr:inosine/xanthosine triphosphatase [candidate division WWE3 bacterium]
MKKVIVASKNPVKIAATENGFNKAFPSESFEFEGVSVESGVSEQPMSEEETLRGAVNRAENAKKLEPEADFWVGIEGGLEEIDEEMEAFAWMVVISKDGKMGKGRSGSFFLPRKVTELIREGKELGEADDIVFNRENSKQKSGSVGILTNDIITRATYYEPAIIFALVPFINPELY